MATKIKEIVEKQYKKKGVDFGRISVGSAVRVNTKIKEGNKERIQAFEGVVIAKKGTGLNAMFTVRKISDGVGVERIYPVHSPMISKIEVVNKGAVRRANISYFKKLTGKAARIKREETSREITAGDASNGSNNAAE